MIEKMSIIAIAAGMMIGFLCFNKLAAGLMFVITYANPFNSSKSFYNLYDAADDELSFAAYTTHDSEIMKYSDYLRLHANARQTAYESFKGAFNTYVKSLLLLSLPISIAPALLFWTYWYFYLLGVAITLVLLVIYQLKKHGLEPRFIQNVVVFSTLISYEKNKAKVD